MRKIVVAPKNMHLSLLNLLRKDDPFLDLKVVSKEELRRSVFPSVKEDAIIYLMKKHHYSYEVSKMYLSDISYVNEDSSNSKIRYLFELRKELLEQDLFYEPVESTYRNQEVEVVGYSENDFELVNILKALNITYEFKNNKDLARENRLYKFEKIEDEVYFVLNEIASLIDSGVSIKDIYILRRNNEYDYYFKKFSKEFGYEINLKNKNNYYSTGGVKEFLRLYETNHDLEESLTSLKELMKDDPLFLEIEDIVRNNTLDDVEFDIQKDYLVNKFKEKSVASIRFDNAVNVIDTPNYTENKHVFVVGFAQGEFPRSFKDDSYLNNNELNQINRLNSKDKTKLDNSSLVNYFNSPNHFLFTFSKRSKEGEKYLSPIEKQLEFKDEKPLLRDVYYSSNVLKLIYANLKDLDYFYKEKGDNFFKVRDVIDIDYNSYSNEYTYKVNAYDDKSFISLSTTSLDLFSNCPFHYYLEKVLCLNEDEESYNLIVGKVSHSIFEHQRECNFDFDRFFDGLIEEYTLKASEKYVLTHNVKEQLKAASKAIKEREKRYKNPCIFNEISLKHNINENTVIKGKIDNLVTFDSQFFACIDYKTGQSKFDDSKLEYGLSTQLPTYALLTLSDKRFSNLTLLGLYINNVLTSSLYVEQKDDELIPSYLKLNGKTLGILDYIPYIDPTIADGKSSFINGLSMKKDGSLKESSSTVEVNTFEEYKKLVNELYINMDRKLRSNSFEIYPLFISDRDNACQYCEYKDICYVRGYQHNEPKREESSDE